MKKLLFLSVIALLFFACQKNDHNQKTDQNRNLKFEKVVPGGCASDSANSNHVVYEEPDTAYYTVNEDTITFFVGFNSVCCLHFDSETSISNDTIYMNLNLLDGPVCSCMCYYTYEFQFTGLTGPVYYVIDVADGFWYFSGYVDI